MTVVWAILGAVMGYFGGALVGLISCLILWFVVSLAGSAATTQRMQAIVRNAQRGNFEFAMIYEQRKTNQILLAGFTNLAQVLDQVAVHITSAIGDLGSSVRTVTTAVNESRQALESQLSAGTAATSEWNKAQLSYRTESARREKNVVQMLDNIQRKKKPPLF